MADFVTTLGVAPSDYWNLTVAQRAAIITAHNKQERRRR